MVQATTHHGWDRPEVDEDEDKWGDFLNNTLDDLDVEVIQKETLANRPAAGTADRWFLATDTKTLFYDTGTAWETIIGQQMSGTTVKLDEIQASDGTAADPKITFRNDVDTGLYRPGANRLGLVSNGVRGLEVDASQDVLIPNGDLITDFVITTDSGHLSIDTAGASTDEVRIHDTYNTRDSVVFNTGGDTEFRHGGILQGSNPADTITETTSPTSFNFSGSRERDIHTFTQVTMSNGSTTSATEDVTVELYDGTDTTGTLVASETRSVTIAAASSTIVSMLTTDRPLDTGTYHIEITTSGTTIAVDETKEQTYGATYTFRQTDTGDLLLEGQSGRDILSVDAVTDDVAFGNGQVSVSRQGEPAPPLDGQGAVNVRAESNVAMNLYAASNSGTENMNIAFHKSDGTFMGAIDGHAKDADPHVSVYYVDDNLATGSPSQQKALTILGGNTNQTTRWENVNRFLIQAGTGAHADLRLVPDTGNDSQIHFVDNAKALHWELERNGTSGAFNLYSHDAAAYAMQVGTNAVADFPTGLQQGGNNVLTTADEGSLDAGTVDGYDSSAFAALGENEAISGNWEVQDNIDFRLGNDADFAFWYDGAGTTPADILKLTDAPTSTSPRDVLTVPAGGTPTFPVGIRSEAAIVVDTGGTGTALNCATGDIINVDDIRFDTGGSPHQISIPNAAGATLSVRDPVNAADVMTWNEGGNVTMPSATSVTVSGDEVTTQKAEFTGSVALSSGVAVVDTAVTSTSAAFEVSLGVQDPAADCKVSAVAYWDDTAGTHKVEISEVDTSVGNPTVNYAIRQTLA